MLFCMRFLMSWTFFHKHDKANWIYATIHVGNCFFLRYILHIWQCIGFNVVSHMNSCIQGVPLFLPPPNFPVSEWRKNRVLNWPPSEMTESRTCHPPKNDRDHNLLPLNSPKFWTLPFFGGGKFLTLSFQRVASSGLCFFFYSGT